MPVILGLTDGCVSVKLESPRVLFIFVNKARLVGVLVTEKLILAEVEVS